MKNSQPQMSGLPKLEPRAADPYHQSPSSSKTTKTYQDAPDIENGKSHLEQRLSKDTFLLN